MHGALKKVMSNFTFRSLMNGRLAASITCAMTGDVVRQLAVIGDRVDIVCGNGDAVGVSLDAEVRYETWFMDRGALLFACTEVTSGWAKLCTEFDVIRYEDGAETTIDAWGANVTPCWQDGAKTTAQPVARSEVATGPIDDNIPF